MRGDDARDQLRVSTTLGAGIYRNGRGDPCDVKLLGRGPEHHIRDNFFDLALSRKGTVVHSSPHAPGADEVDGDIEDTEDSCSCG